MKRITSFLVFLAFFGFTVIAQDIQITGNVTSADDGSILPGVSVVVKGTKKGTTTTVNGDFTIEAPADATLVFSFVGMKTTEINVAGQTVINLSMEMESTGLEEVVVTALGISREKKTLGYSVQEVSGDQVNQVKGDNLVNTLSGKVAGVQIRNANNMGGSANIVIRGQSSLTQNNQALFVIDGVPVDNNNSNNAGQLSGRNGYDYGNTASDINPNDIESISVLKGAAATALYGSRAANGVILITTKKGGKSASGNAVGVNLSSNVTFGLYDKSTFPKYQQEYGGGYGPYYGEAPYEFMEQVDVFGDGTVDNVVPFYEDASRGQKFDPSLMVYHWDALDPESPYYKQASPYVGTSNGPGSFFETAISYTNSVEVTGGNENTKYRLGYTNLNSTGIMPNSELKRNTFIFSGSHNVTDKLKVSTSVNYINNKGKGRNSTGYSDNIMSSFRQWYQVDVDLAKQKELFELTDRNITWNPKYWDNAEPSYWDNPYWVRYKNFEKDERDRLISYVQADYKITDHLSLMGRASIDTYSELQEEHKAVGSASGEFGVARPDVTSGYSRFDRKFTETNLDFLATYTRKFSDAIDFSALVGSNIRRSVTDEVFASTNGGLAVPELYALNNSVDPMLPPEEFLGQIGVNGIFASASVGISNLVFLEGTVRRDVSSTLPTENNAYVYPSASANFLFSNMVDASWLSLGKVRLNYAQVGNDAPALVVKDSYTGNAPFAGNSLATVPDRKNNPELVPEISKSLEAGLEMNFLKSRVGLDLALYQENIIDQLIPVSVSWATGYLDKWVNAGKMENKGVELAVYGSPVATSAFTWRIDLNWAKNVNKVIELFVDESGNEVTNLQLASLQGGVTINARKGESYGTIHGSDYVYNDNGDKIIKANGRYLLSDANDLVIGNFNPDWTAGINNSLKYKNLSMSFLIDWQQGGDVFSLDMWYGMSTGLYEETVGNNDLGNPKRDYIVWVDPDDRTQGYASTSGGTINEGVYDEGVVDWTGEDVSGQPNKIRIQNNNYAADGYAVSPNSRFVYDASYIKLREVVFTYQLPRSIFEKSFVYGASLSFVGSNLWIIHKNLPYADPEASQSSGNVQGWQSGVMPTTRNFGFTLNLQF